MSRIRSKKIQNGVGQLTLVEHALCPVDTSDTPGPFTHQTEFHFTDSHRKRRTGRVRVFCPLGLRPQDEVFLWGLLALTLANSDSNGVLHATRHYLLSQLGMIDCQTRRGGRQYRRFNEAIDRVSAVQYFNDRFYDPIRSEHRRISFGFFSYSMPQDLQSSRAWRIVWDPVFFEFASAARGSLRFDLDTYRSLDVASRRLYLFARKLLARRDVTHPIPVAQLATNVLGYSPNLDVFDQNARLRRCLKRLVSAGVLRDKDTRLYKRSKGRYVVVMARGQFLKEPRKEMPIDSPHLQPLCDIGFEPRDARHLITTYSDHLLQEWIDITLAAKERFGMSFFNRSPAAFLRFYLQRAAAGTDGPPDWWLNLRKAEDDARAKRARNLRSAKGPNQLPQKAMDSLEKVSDDIFQQFLIAGQPKQLAAANALRFKKTQSNRKQ